MADLLQVLSFEFSVFACVEWTAVLLVWSNPNQSNRRLTIHWCFPHVVTARWNDCKVHTWRRIWSWGLMGILFDLEKEFLNGFEPTCFNSLTTTPATNRPLKLISIWRMLLLVKEVSYVANRLCKDFISPLGQIILTHFERESITVWLT